MGQQLYGRGSMEYVSIHVGCRGSMLGLGVEANASILRDEKLYVASYQGMGKEG